MTLLVVAGFIVCVILGYRWQPAVARIIRGDATPPRTDRLDDDQFTREWRACMGPSDPPIGGLMPTFMPPSRQHGRPPPPPLFHDMVERWGN